MALKFIDGFDHYVVGDMGLKYNGSPSFTSMQTGRSGSGQCVRVTNQGGATKTFSTTNSTWVLGCALRISLAPNGNRLFTFDSSTTNQVNIRMASNGQLQIFRNNTQIGDSGSNLFPVNSFNYIEIKVVCNSSTGSVQIKVNGVSWASLTGVNTDNAGSGTINSLSFGMIDFQNLSNTDFDDLYVLDGSGAANNTFLGDVAVQTLYPSGAGTTTQWTPSTGSNYQNVDEAQLNKDTDYNSDSTVGDIDTYAMADLTGTIGSVVGVQHVMAVRKDDAGSRTVSRQIRSGGANYSGSAVALGTTYVFATDILETDPATSSAWTSSGVNALEAGVKIES